MTVPTENTQCDNVDFIREIQRARLRALVDANIDVAKPLHAEDFQLITPGGGTLSKEEYLGSVGTGTIDYLVWDPGSIAVRLSGS